VDTKPLTAEQIDELLRFLPLFDKPGRAFVETWRGGDETPDGAIAMPHPAYLPDVKDFFRLASQACWSDPDYEPLEAAAMLEDEGATRLATIGQIRTMLTYCERGERFCDGHWEAVLRSGRVVALLRRLEILRSETPHTETSTMKWKTFQDLARVKMGAYFQVTFDERNPHGFPKRFDLVSQAEDIVGDAKYLTLVRGVRLPPAKFMEIAGHVWLLEKVPAKRRFLVFGNQRRVVDWWLEKYGTLATTVEFYFLNQDGTPERLK
jgi:hypothetical protein